MTGAWKATGCEDGLKFLLRTLSFSYARHHVAKTLLTLLGVIVGVATFSSIRGAQTTLVSGIRSTVDRMAGKAQLQISAEGGVPEELLETLRERPEVKAQSPVIEQIVVPKRGELGSLLVMGVDLLGDREMRDYGFEGDDADIDDPLLFLAQPDSVAISRSLAEKAGLKAGDTLVLKLPAGERPVTVRGLLTPRGFAEAFGGNLAVMDVYAAQTLFGRGRRFDRIEIRLPEEMTLAEGEASLQALLGPGTKVETPARRGSQLEKLIYNFVVGFNISSGFALGIGTFLIFNAFTVAVNRRRRDIGTLRSLGATPRQVQALFLLEAAVIGLLGSILGVFAGRGLTQSMLDMMGQTTETIFGVSDASRAQMPLETILLSVVLGLVASLAAAWGPARVASKIPPTEVFAKGAHQARLEDASPLRLASGAFLLLSAILLPSAGWLTRNALVFPVLILSAAGCIVLIGPLARASMRKIAPFLSRVSPVAGQLASDSLLSNPRRTSGSILAMTISLSFVLGLGGYMGATKAVMVRWMDDILTSDLYVRASASLVRPDFRFPAELKAELESIPGVRAVESYRSAQLEYRGEQIQIASIEFAQMMERTRHEYLEGTNEEMLQGVAHEGKCAVSDNLARKLGIHKGDILVLSTPSGEVSFEVAAAFRDFTADRGTVFMDRSTFLKYWKDDRVDTYDVNLHPGADAGAVRDRIREKLSGRLPALISTRKEFKAEIARAIDSFYALIRITVFLALVVAFLGIVTALLISVVERTREIGILKALGALGKQIRHSIVLEALLLAFTGLLLALPLGDLLARFMETSVAETFAGWRMPHRYPWELLGQLLVALPAVSALAAWVPARQAVRTKVTEAIEYE